MKTIARKLKPHNELAREESFEACRLPREASHRSSRLPLSASDQRERHDAAPMPLTISCDPTTNMQAVRTWLDLPGDLFDRAEKCRTDGTISSGAIADIEIAIVVALSRVAKLRLRDLLGLRYHGLQADITIPSRAGGLASILVPASKCRPHRAMRVRLDSATTAILKRYVTHYRPEIAKRRGGVGTSLLFPGLLASREQVVTRNIVAMRIAFDERMREAGLYITLYQLRHISARLVLDSASNVPCTVLLSQSHHPGRYREVYAAPRLKRKLK